MPKIIGLGIYDEDNVKDIIDIEYFSSEKSLLDYSCAVINIKNVVYEYTQHPSKFGGLTYLNNENASSIIKDDMKRRREEIIELLKQGCNIFVLLPSEQHIYIMTGKKEFSGTGKNRAVTNLLDEFNLLSFLPVEIEVTKATGHNITYVGDERFDIIKEDILNNMEYCSYISNGNGRSLLQITNTTKSVGMLIEHLNGKIILLPQLSDDDDLYNNDSEWELAYKKYINALVTLDDSLKKSIGEFELPEWSKNFFVPKEKEEIKELNILMAQLEEVKNKISSQKKTIEKLQRLKLVFTSSGAVLEKICKEIFFKLGFTELPTENNRSDLVLKYGSKNIVVEIKGLSKNAAEKNAAQLEKWACEHIEKYDITPKAILLVNAFRNIELDKRSEDVFPNQMLRYASNREQCLLSTTQFLCLYIDCMKNPEKKENIITKLLNTVGVYDEYTDYQNYIEKV